MEHRIEKRISGFLASAWGRRLLSVLLAAVCMLLTHALFRVTFLNNDDTNIMYALAGYRSGAPYPTHRFINVLLGLGISALYAAAPSVPWWAAYQLTMLFCSIAVINDCALKTALRARIPLWTAVLALVLLYAAVLVYPVVWMTFTLTAALLGTAGVALVLTCDGEKDGRGARITTSIGAILLMLLCFLTRNSSGYSMLCFMAAAVLYRLLSARGRAKWRIAAVTALGAALVALTVVINSLGVTYYNPTDYRAFETARGHFVDYPHAAYADDPAFFEALGWDDTVYALADNMCYLDPSVNAATMEAAAAHRTDGDAGLKQKLMDTLTYGVNYFRGSGASEYMLVITVAAFLLALACYAGKRRGREELFIACATAAGAFLLCFYLCFKGRFPVRTFMLIAIPATVVEGLMALRLYAFNDRRFLNAALWRELFCRRGYRRRKTLYVLAAACAACVLLWSLTKTQIQLFRYDKSDCVSTSAAAEQYVMHHEENIYITDVTSIENIDAFTVYPEDKPLNLIDWGGTGLHSGWKNAQLAVNGLTGLTADVFGRDDVFFMTETNGEKLALLNAYLSKHAGYAGYEAVEGVAGTQLTVYRFIPTAGGEVAP